MGPIIMKWVLLILSLHGDPKIVGTYDDRAKCEDVMRPTNSPSSYLYAEGVQAHCLPLPPS